MSYVKVVLTAVKYVPQVWINYKLQSTAGWSILNVMLDLVGGVLSIVQLVMDSIVSNDQSGILGFMSKAGLGIVSIAFDIVFILQHYYWYGGNHGKKFTAIPDEADPEHAAEYVDQKFDDFSAVSVADIRPKEPRIVQKIPIAA